MAYRGFRQDFQDVSLVDVHMEGYPFIWFKSLGTPRVIEEKLDRALANNSWMKMFPDAKLKNLVAPSSYHFPILLDRTLVAWSHRIKRSFKFENAWRIEDGLNEVVHNSWLRSAGNNVINKLSACAEDMTHWSKTHCNKLQINIEKCQNHPSRSCGINGIQDEAQFDNLRKKTQSSTCSRWYVLETESKDTLVSWHRFEYEVLSCCGYF